MKHLSSVITMNLFHNFYTRIQIDNYNPLYFSCWLRGKSALPHCKVKKDKQLCNKQYGLKKCGSKVVG